MALKNPAISGDHGQGIGVSMGYIPLLEGDASGTCERSAMKKK